MPRISLVVPTHNRRELLQKKLQALEGETGDFEVIVVVDGCQDSTLEFLGGYRPRYPLVVLETPGRGAAHARNRGAEVAQGAVLLFSDDDVIPRPGFLPAHLEAHTRPQVVGVGKLVLPSHLQEGAAFTGPKAFWWNATGANTSVPQELFAQAGGYDESFSGYGGEDPDLGYRLRRAGARFVFLPRAEAEHWDEAYGQNLVQKARQAGAAHVRVWRKYDDARIAWALGVHPSLLALKLATLPWLRGFMGRQGDYELAYAQGAWSAWSQK